MKRLFNFLTIPQCFEYCCLFILSVNIYAQTPTDEELKALEQQIERQEAEEKKRAADEAKRKLEEEIKIEMEKQSAAEEEKHKFIEEEQAKLKAEAEKREKYNLLIKEAEHAINNKDKDLAINKYNEVLALYPNDTRALSGLSVANKMLDRSCLTIVGDWMVDWALSRNIKVTFYEDNSGLLHPVPHYDVKWNCVDSVERKFHIVLQSTIFPNKKPNEWKISLLKDGKLFNGTAESGQPVKGEKINASGLSDREEN